MDIATALSKLDAKPKGAGKWRAPCPAHNGDDRNLEIRDDGGKAFFTCYSHGCDYTEILAAMGEAREVKRQPVAIAPPAPDFPPPMPDFPPFEIGTAIPENGQGKRKKKKPEYIPKEKDVTATYEYKNEKSIGLSLKKRYEPKDFPKTFRQGYIKDGKWIPSMKGIRRVLYNLPAVIEANTVFVVEGEKDVDRLGTFGIVATTNFDGAGKWLADYNPFFKGKSVYIIPDLDAQGDAHAKLVYNNIKDIAANCKIIDLLGLTEKGADVSDWFETGGTALQLLEIATEPPTVESVEGIPKITSGRELYDKYFPPLEFVIDGMFALGHLFLLGGRPKSGKSWMMLQLATAIDKRMAFLGRKTRKCKVLYLALEDGERRINQRMKILNWIPREIDFMFSLLPLSTGDGNPGLEQLEKLAPFYDLIIIDTLIATLNGTTNENDNVQMGNVMQGLADIAHEGSTAIGIVHHTGKAKRDDPFNGFRGASAIRAAYDVGAILDREVGESEAVLYLESRDFDIEDMTIKQKEDGAGWDSLGGKNVIHDIKAGKRVMQIIGEFGDDMTVAEYASLAEITTQAARAALKMAEKRGLITCIAVQKDGKGRAIDTYFEA